MTARAIPQKLPTPRQLECSRLLGTAGSIKEVADRLNLNEGTVQYHLAEIRRRLNIPSLYSLVAWQTARDLNEQGSNI